jgi:hypothetical protein
MNVNYSHYQSKYRSQVILTKPEFKIKFNENYEDDNINIQILETQIENHNAKILNIHLRSEGNKRDGLIRFKSIIE